MVAASGLLECGSDLAAEWLAGAVVQTPAVFSRTDPGYPGVWCGSYERPLGRLRFCPRCGCCYRDRCAGPMPGGKIGMGKKGRRGQSLLFGGGGVKIIVPPDNLVVDSVGFLVVLSVCP